MRPEHLYISKTSKSDVLGKNFVESLQ